MGGGRRSQSDAPRAPRRRLIADLSPLRTVPGRPHPSARQENRHAHPVGGLTFDAYTGTILIELLDLDEDGEPIPGTECGFASLEGWDIH